jgi:hypothetical protein
MERCPGPHHHEQAKDLFNLLHGQPRQAAWQIEKRTRNASHRAASPFVQFYWGRGLFRIEGVGLSDLKSLNLLLRRSLRFPGVVCGDRVRTQLYAVVQNCQAMNQINFSRQWHSS